LSHPSATDADGGEEEVTEEEEEEKGSGRGPGSRLG